MEGTDGEGDCYDHVINTGVSVTKSLKYDFWFGEEVLLKWEMDNAGSRPEKGTDN